MVYLMLIIGICISAYGIILLKKEAKESESFSNETEEVIFNEEDVYEDENIYEDGYIQLEDDNDKDLEKNIDFNEIIKEKMGSIEIEYDEKRDEKIHEKLNRIEDMLKPMVDTTDREKKLFLLEKEIIKRERAVKRNETRIDKLVEAKMKALSKTKSMTKKNTSTAAGNTQETSKSPTARTAKTARKSTETSVTNKVSSGESNKENDKNKIIEKIKILEEQGKNLEEIASDLSLGKGEVLLLRSIQKQL